MSSGTQQHHQQQIIEWRRAKIMELMSKGQTNQSEIARLLQIDRSTVCRDISFLRQQTKHNIKTYIDERLPFEYELCQVGINKILQKAWDIIDNDDEKATT